MKKSFSKKFGALFLILSVGLITIYYMVMTVIPLRGGDMFLRLAEAQYFILGINPYDVYQGLVLPVAGVGDPNVYSFVSYLLMVPLTAFEPGRISIVIFSLFDLLAFASVSFVLKKYGLFSPIAFSATLTLLLASVFFWQHVIFLNYNVIVAGSLFVGLWAAREKRMPIFLIAGFLVGLKPTIFISFFILLLVRGHWRHAIAISVLQSMALTAVCIHLGLSPLDYAIQLVETVSNWTSVENYGLLSFAIYSGIEPSTSLSILISTVIILAAAVRFPGDAISDYALCIFVSLAFYYNNVHAWMMIFPLFSVWAKLYLEEHTSLWIGLMLGSFVIVPRLLSLYPQDYNVEIILLHNTLRFAALGCITLFFLSRTNGENKDPIPLEHPH